jgi:hypothetical protein
MAAAESLHSTARFMANMVTRCRRAAAAAAASASAGPPASARRTEPHCAACSARHFSNACARRGVRLALTQAARHLQVCLAAGQQAKYCEACARPQSHTCLRSEDDKDVQSYFKCSPQELAEARIMSSTPARTCALPERHRSTWG